MIQQNDLWPPRHQPVAIVTRHPGIAELIECLADESFGGPFLKLNRGGVWVVWPDQEIPILPLLLHRRGLGAQHRINPPKLPANLPTNFKQKRLLRRRRNR